MALMMLQRARCCGAISRRSLATIKSINDNEVYVCGFARTPIGKLSGALASQTAPQLGAHAIKSAIVRAGINQKEIDEVFMGNVVSAGL